MSRVKKDTFAKGEVWSAPGGLCWVVISVSDTGIATLRNGPHWDGGRDVERSVTDTSGWKLEMRASRKAVGGE